MRTCEAKIPKHILFHSSLGMNLLLHCNSPQQELISDIYAGVDHKQKSSNKISTLNVILLDGWKIHKNEKKIKLNTRGSAGKVGEAMGRGRGGGKDSKKKVVKLHSNISCDTYVKDERQTDKHIKKKNEKGRERETIIKKRS